MNDPLREKLTYKIQLSLLNSPSRQLNLTQSNYKNRYRITEKSQQVYGRLRKSLKATVLREILIRNKTVYDLVAIIISFLV